MRYYLTYFFLLSNLLSTAQTDVYNNKLSLKLGYGALIAHRDFMRHLVTGHSPLVEFSYGFNAYGERSYEEAYLMPEIGVSTVFIASGNPSQIGNCYGVYPYINLPLGKRKFVPELRLGMGAGFVSKPFNPKTNYKNNAIGSFLNACVLIEFKNNISVNNRLNWNYGFSLTHFSNGSFKLPNLGLNFVTLNTGFGYNVGNKKEFITNKNTSYDKSLKLNLLAHLGVRSNSEDSPLYPIYTITAEATKRISYKSKILFGIEGFYNTSVQHLDDYETIVFNKDTLTRNSNLQSGIYIGYGIVFNTFSINIINGLYTHNLNKTTGLFYHRISLRKELGDNLYFTGGLKTHFATAEYIELGVGYKLR